MRTATFVLALSFLATSRAVAQGWVDVTPATPGPTATTGSAAMCYDPVRQVTWLFRGVDQVFSWDGTTWTTVAAPVPPSSSPGGGTAWKAVWHPGMQQVIVARDSGGHLDLTAWDGQAWTALPSLVLNPTIFFDYSGVVVDTNTNDIQVVSRGGGSVATMRVTTFDGTSWQTAQPSISPSVPHFGGLNLPSFFFDATSGRTVMVATPWVGITTGVFIEQYWEWDGSSWIQAYPATLVDDLGPVVEVPSRGFSAALQWDLTYGSPRMFTVANRQFDEVFLTNWPAMRSRSLFAYDSVRDRFIVHGGENQIGSGLYSDTWELDLGPNAAFTTSGAGCIGSGGVPQLAAQAGTVPAVNTQFSIQVSNLPWTGPCFMWLGFSNQSYGGIPLPVNLAVLGAPQCDVMISPDQLYAIPNVLGTSVWTIAIPNLPGWTFYNQAIAFDANANALGLVFSNASQAIVGQ